ncbi:hypothetical protein ACH4ZX_15425 [Streptomyces sp. NPDC020490]
MLRGVGGDEQARGGLGLRHDGAVLEQTPRGQCAVDQESELLGEPG